MTREVFITIAGMQLEDGQEPVTIKAPAIYHYANGKHYVQYEEEQKDGAGAVKNTLKIAPSEIVLSKKGIRQSQMSFCLTEISQTFYQTPYGSLELEISTKSIKLKEEENRLEVKLEYSLSAASSHLSDNRLMIVIEAVARK